MKRSVVAIIKGGLGNQLFAYSAARAFAIRTDRELFIDDDSGFLRDGYGRSFRLNQFPITAEPAPAKLRLGDPKGFHFKWINGLNKVTPGKRRSYLKENPEAPSSQLTELESSAPVIHLNGYWQNEAYFSPIADTLRRELTPAESDPELENELRRTNSVFIHIRRVRYSPTLPADYYNTSIQHLIEKTDSPSFEVFGDDLDWPEKHLDFGDRPVRFHKGDANDELRDYRLMSQCRHAIVANSSFSWWGAWIRPSTEKIVCTPQNPGWPVHPAKDWTTIEHGPLE